MAGTIAADTLTHSTAGSIATNYVVEGSAKAWNNTNSTGTTINDSFNIASLTDSGTGIQSHNVTNAFDSANHVPVFTPGNNISETWIQSMTASAWQTRCYTGSSYVDNAVRTTSHGDLA
jgi:hypothetical protein